MYRTQWIFDPKNDRKTSAIFIRKSIHGYKAPWFLGQLHKKKCVQYAGIYGMSGGLPKLSK